MSSSACWGTPPSGNRASMQPLGCLLHPDSSTDIPAPPDKQEVWFAPLTPVHLSHHAAAWRLQHNFPGPCVYITTFLAGLRQCRRAWSAPSTRTATGFSDQKCKSLWGLNFYADEFVCHLHDKWDLKCILSISTCLMQISDYKDEVDCNDCLLSCPT